MFTQIKYYKSDNMIIENFVSNHTAVKIQYCFDTFSGKIDWKIQLK